MKWINAVLATTVLAGSGMAVASELPDGYQDWPHYATVTRGNVREELFTSQAAIDAAKQGQPLPQGTIIVMEDYRNDQLFRYITMEKDPALVSQFSASERAGDWKFTSFHTNKAINSSEDETRCMSCHQSQSGNDFVFTYGRMKSYQP